MSTKVPFWLWEQRLDRINLIQGQPSISRAFNRILWSSSANWSWLSCHGVSLVTWWQLNFLKRENDVWCLSTFKMFYFPLTCPGALFLICIIISLIDLFLFSFSPFNPFIILSKFMHASNIKSTFFSICSCSFCDNVLPVTSRWHCGDTISGNLLKCSQYDWKAVCLDRSGTWPVGNWNSPWLDTSVPCVVWRSAVAAPTCSPVEKTSKSSVGIWNTTRYDVVMRGRLMWQSCLKNVCNLSLKMQ